MDELSVKCLLDADDRVILAPSACRLQKIVNKMNDFVQKRSMKINVGKTKVMVFERDESMTECDILIGNEKVKQVEKLVYLGSLFKNDGKDDRDIERRVNVGNEMNGALLAIKNSKTVSQQSRLAIHNGVLIPTLMYGGKSWLWQKKNESRINAVEMRSLRSMCRVSRKDKCRNNDEWMVKYDQEQPVQPRYDLNAPDLYIPSMGYVTYVLLAGFMLGLQHRFSPEQIGMQASSALAYIVFEMVLYLGTLYVTDTRTNLATFDLLAFSGYKYTAMTVTLMAALALARPGYYAALAYTSFSLSYFLVKTLRVQVLSGAEGRVHAYGYAAANPYADEWAGGGAVAGGGGGSGGTKRRVYFLLFVAVMQPLLSWWLTYHLVPAAAALAPPAR
ncbi:Protein YIF1B-B [Eumeta japonica]|uniref:Protein YIF1 n=1 Tax=Eumeta variegata TaxID=151549 RepID=A0A4C1WHN4_EUMVA|nr:Protein YIF1B-B [Eumeta japonica]